MKLAIQGLGTALPPYPMSQTDAADLTRQVCCQTDEQASLVKVLYRRSGVKNRYTVLPYETALQWSVQSQGNGGGTAVELQGPGTQQRMAWYAELAPPLALRASQEAFERAERSPRQVTHLVTVSCTGFAAPGIDVALINQLGLPPTVQRTHVGFMGCHGAINGLRVAQAFVESDPTACVLLCAVETCSLHYCTYWEPNKLVGNAIFGDGAGALVASAARSAEEWQLAGCGSCLLPDSEDAICWNVGDNGFEMVLSPRVPDLIERHLRPWLAAWLDRHDLAIEDIRSWAIHPGGPRILTAVERALELPPEATAVSREVLAQHGNMSSPTVLFILDRYRNADAPRPCVALGFGPGLVAEAALFV